MHWVKLGFMYIALGLILLVVWPAYLFFLGIEKIDNWRYKRKCFTGKG